MAEGIKTTLELPADLLREIKLRAVNENRRIKDVVADAIRRGLDIPGPDVRHRVQLPLIRNRHAAAPDRELTPDRIAEILLTADVQAAQGIEP